MHSGRAGERVKTSVTKYLRETLKLTVNEKKSAVARPWKRKFLGYTVTMDKATRLKAAEPSVKRVKDKLRDIFRNGRGSNMGRFIKEKLNPIVRGWGNYYRLTRVKWIFEELDGWMDTPQTSGRSLASDEATTDTGEKADGARAG